MAAGLPLTVASWIQLVHIRLLTDLPSPHSGAMGFSPARYQLPQTRLTWLPGLPSLVHIRLLTDLPSPHSGAMGFSPAR